MAFDGDYRKLRTEAVIFDLSNRTKLKLSGAETHVFLHNIGTADILSLAVGGGTHCAFLNRFGKVLADTWVYRAYDHFIIDANEGQRVTIKKLLHRGAQLSSITVEDLTDSFSLLSVQGPKADAFDAMFRDFFRPQRSRTGEKGFDIFLSRHEKETQVHIEDLPIAGLDVLETARIEAAIPEFGKDVTQESLVLEGGFDDAISMSKGCYVGQEIVSRMKNMGVAAPHRIVAIRVQSSPPAVGSPVFSGDAQIGVVTSSSPLPGIASSVAFARINAGEPTRVGTAQASLLSVPPKLK